MAMKTSYLSISPPPSSLPPLLQMRRGLVQNMPLAFQFPILSAYLFSTSSTHTIL